MKARKSGQAWLAGLWLLACIPAAATATVHKCRTADGRLTYQQLPCADSEQRVGSDIPSEFPAPNAAERDRILQRDADLMRRLEAQRDRMSAEAIARVQQPDTASVPVERVFVPVYGPARAFRGPHRPVPRNAYRAWSSGRLH